MKHKHYEMIVVKAANMDLVVLCKNAVGEWIEQEYTETTVKFSETGFGYFLCLPQHKEACLHWLNGGHETLECNSPFTDGFEQCYKLGGWKRDGGYMREDCEYRVKPKKEKRWIAVKGESVCFVNHEIMYPDDYQLIEIEVEV